MGRRKAKTIDPERMPRLKKKSGEKVTQREIAELLVYEHESTVNKILHGKENIPQDVLDKLAKNIECPTDPRYHISPRYLTGEQEEPITQEEKWQQLFEPVENEIKKMAESSIRQYQVITSFLLAYSRYGEDENITAAPFPERLINPSEIKETGMLEKYGLSIMGMKLSPEECVHFYETLFPLISDYIAAYGEELKKKREEKAAVDEK